MLPNHHTDLSPALRHVTRRQNLPESATGEELRLDQLLALAADASVLARGASEAAHLLDLFAMLPAPSTSSGRQWWITLSHVAGAELHPTNLKHAMLSAGGGEPAGLAGAFLSALEQREEEQRFEIIEVLDQKLEGADAGLASAGQLWLEDAERTAWRVLVTSREERPSTAEVLGWWREA